MSFRLRVAIPTLLFAVCIAIADAPCLPTAAEAGYRLNPGDMIRLSVWEEESLTREAVVHPDGSVSFPLAGQVPAAGRTLADLQAEVTQRIKKYVADPVVTVELLEARGNR